MGDQGIATCDSQLVAFGDHWRVMGGVARGELCELYEFVRWRAHWGDLGGFGSGRFWRRLRLGSAQGEG